MIEHVRPGRIGVGADPGQVRDTADIQETDRPGIRRQRGVIDRRERRPLAPRGHIRCAEIVNHVHAQQARQQGAVADLECAVVGRIVEDCMAMKAGHIDIVRGNPCCRQQRDDGFGMPPGQFLGQCRVGRRLPQRCTQFASKHIVIRLRPGGDRLDKSAAIRAQESDVDPVHRRAAHHADSQLHIARSHVPPFPIGAAKIYTRPSGLC